MTNVLPAPFDARGFDFVLSLFFAPAAGFCTSSTSTVLRPPQNPFDSGACWAARRAFFSSIRRRVLATLYAIRLFSCVVSPAIFSPHSRKSGLTHVLELGDKGFDDGHSACV